MSDGIGRVGIVGAGQVGTMLGLALRAAPGVDKVLLTDRDPLVAKASAGLGAGEPVDAEEAIRSDTVVLALPVPEILRFLEERAKDLPGGSLVIDTGSVKRLVVEAMRRTIPKDVDAVGGHPMAGTEQAGPEGARRELLRDAAFVLTPVREDPGALARAEALVQAAGARTVLMTPELHDRVVARTSHLLHIAAAALALVVEKQPPGAVRDLAAAGYSGATRLAASDPEMVSGFLDTNREQVLEALREVRDVLEQAAHSLGDRDTLREFLQGAATARAAALG